MKILTIVLCCLVAVQAGAAREASKIQKSFARPSAAASTPATSEFSAIFSTNMIQLGKSRPNASLSFLLFKQAGVNLSYLSYADRKVYSNSASKASFTAEKTQVGIGGDYFFRPVSSVWNFVATPSLVFENEKDPFVTKDSNGFGLKVMGTYRPMDKLMAQAGASSTWIGSTNSADFHLGMGLLF